MEISSEEFIDIVKNLAEPGNTVKKRAEMADDYRRIADEYAQQLSVVHRALDAMSVENERLKANYESACKSEAEALTERNALRDQLAAKRLKV